MRGVAAGGAQVFVRGAARAAGAVPGQQERGGATAGSVRVAAGAAAGLPAGRRAPPHRG